MEKCLTCNMKDEKHCKEILCYCKKYKIEIEGKEIASWSCPLCGLINLAGDEGIPLCVGCNTIFDKE